MNRFERYDEDLVAGTFLFFASPFLQAASIWFEVEKLSHPNGFQEISLGILVPVATALLLYKANTSQMDVIAKYHEEDERTRRNFPDDIYL